MRTPDTRSREIVDIIADVAARVAQGCTISFVDRKGRVKEVPCPPVTYLFGNAEYLKDTLNDFGNIPNARESKFPLIHLFCPFVEERRTADYRSKATVRILIAYCTTREMSNEQRKCESFENVLRPIYRRFIEALRQDTRLEFGYDGIVEHDYSENYSYGKYGAYSGSGEAVSEPIDAIDITNLRLTVKQINCR